MGDPGHILVVDDDRMNRLTLKHAIERLGHTSAAAEDGRQALEMLGAGVYDVVLLDIMMPEMDGFEVLSHIKADSNLRDIPVIVISGLEEMGSAARCIELGAEDYLTKPFNSVLLNARLTASLEKKQHRDLERAYLQQEIMLRQSEKLATLGRLAAGMAHELNNPVAASQRGVQQIGAVVLELRQACLQLARIGITSAQSEAMSVLVNIAESRAGQVIQLDPLSRSDREAEIEACLHGFGVTQPWEYSATIVNLGIEVSEMNAYLAVFTRDQTAAVVAVLSGIAALYDLIGEMRQGLGAVTQVVDALKSYSFMDQAPVQLVNVHAGLDDTLRVVPALADGKIVVERDYAPDLPRIEAYGSELNQVWSNLIDNAVAALEETPSGSGRIAVRTIHEAERIRVEIEDDGPGIPPEIRSKVFDPFFTTRPPGQGAGLGLTISYNVVQKHGGSIEVRSQPGSTRVIVDLPLAAPADTEPAPIAAPALH